MTDIFLKPIEKPQILFRIIGTAPLICGKKPILVDGKNPNQSKEDVVNFHNAYYLLDGSTVKVPIYGFPATGVKKCMVEACRLTGNTMTVIKPTIFVEANNLRGLLELSHPEGKKLDPVMFLDSTRNKSGQIVTQVGAQFNEWQLDFLVSFWDRNISAEGVTILLQHAGEFIGLGINRRGKGLFSYGTFRIATSNEQ